MSFVPYALSWNITSRCNLACQHCYMDAGMRESGYDDELSTEKAKEILQQIAQVNPGAVLILTGGEPLMRPDIYEICASAKELGFMVVLGTNGTMLTPEVVSKLKESGVSGLGVSIDSLETDRHETFRGKPGSLKESIKGLENARDVGIDIQVQTTPTNDNLDEMEKIAEWAHKIGAKVFNIFFLVCTGRGEKMSDISPESYEKVLKWAADSQDKYPGMMIRPKCAPHFKRVLFQQNSTHPLLSTYIAACRAGTHYCRITPSGKVTPCPYMEVESGDLLKTDFATIWNESESLKKYRTPEYGGKCGLCRFRLLCGGCRARAYAETGDEMAEDRWCVYEPLTQEEAITNLDTEAKFGTDEEIDSNGAGWSDEAKEKLTRMPVFVRSMVKLASKKYASENNIDVITPEIMRKAAPPPGNFSPASSDSDKAANAIPKPEAENGDIPWDEDASVRVKDAPSFVQPGIWKVMQLRAKSRGKTRITSEFLTEIRDESLMLVTKRMKNFGFDQPDMNAWNTAKDKFKNVPKKRQVIDSVVELLNNRPQKNDMIMKKFVSFFSDDSKTMAWTEEARERLNKAPVFVRPMAKKAVEKFAKKRGYKVVTEEAFNEALAKSPFGSFAKPSVKK